MKLYSLTAVRLTNYFILVLPFHSSLILLFSAFIWPYHLFARVIVNWIIYNYFNIFISCLWIFIIKVVSGKGQIYFVTFEENSIVLYTYNRLLGEDEKANEFKTKLKINIFRPLICFFYVRKNWSLKDVCLLRLFYLAFLKMLWFRVWFNGRKNM